MNPIVEFLRILGSLRLAAILLVLSLFSMACATVFESMHGTEKALAIFYRAWWFQGLLGLFALNVLASILVRIPLTKKQIGFVLTHVGILLILGGATMTKLTGLDGQLGIAEGETLDSFLLPGRPALSLATRAGDSMATVDLTGAAFRSFDPVDDPATSPLTLDGVEVTVKRYLPDAEFREQVVNDNPRVLHAVEVSVPGQGGDVPRWIFDGRNARIGATSIAFRTVPSAAELERLLAAAPATESDSVGSVKVDVGGTKFEFPVEACRKSPVPLGETGYTLQVLRYLPHAVVGEENKVVNVSERPENPAVEIELVRGEERETRVSFAKFPDFRSMHGGGAAEDVDVVFIAGAGAAARGRDPIEILAGPDGALHVRFAPQGGEATSRVVPVGEPIETPWSGMRLVVRHWYQNARMDWSAVPVVPARDKGREPALLVRVTASRAGGEGEDSAEMWVQKYRRADVSIGGKPYLVTFSDKTVPLGFQVKLDRFRVGYYPGTRRPRSFESHITIVDPAAGATRSQVVSMNRPVKHGGFTLFQSSYRMGQGPTVSFLSVSRGRGQLFTFLGYFVTILGMFVVLGIRMYEGKAQARLRALLQT